ncbi:MAG TPA: hypothetical protein VGI79_12605 [Caulobacteraceae bacterium]|jgi:hypothetical protein
MSASPFPVPFAAASPRLRRFAMAAFCGSALISSAACATAASYNPGSLRTDQLSRVEGICQSDLGLSPSEPLSLVWGAAVNPGLTGGENHFQGCVASLSASLRDVDDGQAAWQADHDCRARGLKPESSDLAECVLQSLKSHPAATTSAPSAEPVSMPVTRPKGSFFTASNHEVRDREERACARLGLNPAYGAFGQCVKSLSDTFFSIDNPEN